MFAQGRTCMYNKYSKYFLPNHIRPQTEENMVSRPLCLNQASDRSVSSWVGDHQRIPVVVCFFSPAFLFFAMKLLYSLFV